jgi:hypothetical protein
MLKIAHRINTIFQLQNTPPELGVELDLRPEGDRIIMHHDAFKEGEDFEEWLKHYKHQLIILNTKAEGMEDRILELMSKYEVKNYFFLDLSLPYLIKYMKKGVHQMAIRFSEYEGLDTVLAMKDKVKWVWVDCFNTNPLTKEIYHILKNAGFKLCFVSPDLQQQENKIGEYNYLEIKCNIHGIFKKNSIQSY